MASYDKDEKFNPEKSPKTYKYVKDHILGAENMVADIRCNRCGRPVLKSDNKRYTYQCMNCDEDLFETETHCGRPYTDSEFNDLCLDTEALLELDNNADEEEMIRLTYYTQNTETLLELLYLVAEKAMLYGMQNKGPCPEGKMSKDMFDEKVRKWLSEKRTEK